MNRRYLLAKRLLMSLFISSTAAFLGIVSESTAIKVLAGVCQVVTIGLSIDVIKRYQRLIKWRIALTYLAIMCVYPLVRITITVLHEPTFKIFTDAFFIHGGYYQLVIVGLALAVLTRDGSGYPLLYRFAFYAIPVGILMIAFGIKADEETSVGFGQLAINNCFIPVALLALYPSQKKSLALGWFSIAVILIVAAHIDSRSYTLVGVYFAALSIFAFFRTGHRKWGYTVIILLAVAYFSGAYSFFNTKSVDQNESVADKYQFATLQRSLGQFLHDGNLVRLFFWEGNSRAGIIVDAFGGFDRDQWLWGKGIFGRYSSFTERSTIEIGWAQELFRWGIPYIVLTLICLLYARRRLKKGPYRKVDLMAIPLASLIGIKLLDGMVFGMPYNTIYSAIVFWGVMRTALSTKIIVCSPPLSKEIKEPSARSYTPGAIPETSLTV